MSVEGNASPFDLSNEVMVSVASSLKLAAEFQPAGRVSREDIRVKSWFEREWAKHELIMTDDERVAALESVNQDPWKARQEAVAQEIAGDPDKLRRAKLLARAVLSREKGNASLIDAAKNNNLKDSFDHVLVVGIQELAKETAVEKTKPAQALVFDQTSFDWEKNGWDKTKWNDVPTFENSKVAEKLAGIVRLVDASKKGLVNEFEASKQLEKIEAGLITFSMSDGDRKSIDEALVKVKASLEEFVVSKGKTLEKRVIGHALGQMEPSNAREVVHLLSPLERVKALPERLGQPYDADTLNEYKRLVDLSTNDSSITNEVCLKALQDLIDVVQSSGKDWVFDLSDVDQAKVFGSALRALDLISKGDLYQVLDEQNVNPMEMTPINRALYYAKVERQIKRLFGLDQDLSSDQLQNLLGDIEAIAPGEMRNVLNLMQRSFAKSFKGKLTDELLIYLDAFGGGEQGGTYAHLLELANMSGMSVEDWGKHMKSIKPNELFFLINMPFTVEQVDGSEVTITTREIIDFLLSPEGIKTFRMAPYREAKDGVSEYIQFMKNKYPLADKGLNIKSTLKVVDVDRGGGMKKAEVLDEGNTAIGDTDENTWIKMATNPTWLRKFRMAQGFIHAMVNRGVIYRDGDVFKISPEMQKSANLWAFYLEAYALFDGELRDTLPRFRSMWEYMLPTNPIDFFNDQAGLEPDVVDPFHPRPENVRSKGMKILHTNPIEGKEYNDEARARDAFDMVRLFYGIEDDPAETNFQDAVAELVAAKAGYFYDDLGEKHEFKALNDDELRNLAWEWNKKIYGKVWEVFSKTYEPDLETMLKYRTFYALPQEVVMQRLESVPSGIAKRLKRYDYSDKVIQLGGIPSADCTGVEGLKEVAKAMGNRVLTGPRWGTVPKNATDKHQGYEATMIEIQKSVMMMQIGANQAKEEEAKELADMSIGRGHQSFEERFMQAADKAILKYRGIQPDPKLRGASIDEFYENYAKAISAAGMMTNNKGIWWITRRAWKRAEYMVGKPTMRRFLADKPYILEKGKKKHRAVIFGVHKATYTNTKNPANALYKTKDLPVEALAILGCHVENGKIVYSAHAGGIHPIAMVMKDGDKRPVVDSRLVNTAELSGHLIQIDENQDTALKALREGLIDILNDSLIDDRLAEAYYSK